MNPIVSHCRQLTQKECKTRHDKVGKVINRELCKKLKFDYTTELYMHKLGSVLLGEMHKIFWNFEIQTDPLITAIRPDLVIINNNKKKKT